MDRKLYIGLGIVTVMLLVVGGIYWQWQRIAVSPGDITSVKNREPSSFPEGRSLTLKQAYKIAKPAAISKIGSDADLFNAITTDLRKDGTAETWLISFGSVSNNKSVAVAIANGKIETISPVVTINPEEDEDVTPLKPGWIDSVEVAKVVPEGWENTDKIAFHWYFDSKAKNNEGDTWQIIAKNKFWNVDLYSGEVVSQGEQKEEIKIPMIR